MKNRLFGCLLLLLALAVILPLRPLGPAQSDRHSRRDGPRRPGAAPAGRLCHDQIPGHHPSPDGRGHQRTGPLPVPVPAARRLRDHHLPGRHEHARPQGRQVGVGQTTTIDAVLEQKTLSESIVVIGQAPTIDQKSTTGSTNLDQVFLASVPATRNLDSFFNMAPGVVAEQNNTNGLMSSANGSAVRDNTFNLDGVNMTAPDVGTQQVEFGVDIIEEISIQSGGLPAEYGDASGASVNVVTRSGGNRLSGAASVYYNSEHLQSNNTAGTALEGTTSGYRYIFEPVGHPGRPDRQGQALVLRQPELQHAVGQRGRLPVRPGDPGPGQTDPSVPLLQADLPAQPGRPVHAVLQLLGQPPGQQRGLARS